MTQPKPDWWGDTDDPRFLEWLASLPKSTTYFKDEYAPPGECIHCFAVEFSQTHVEGTPGYNHEYENPADNKPDG